MSIMDNKLFPHRMKSLQKTALELSVPASEALLKNRKNSWVQLSGHAGAFAPAGPRTIWKRRLNDTTETRAYQALMLDKCADVVPTFFREVEYNGEFFIELEDLLHHFNSPSIMDVKMGCRTFLESEVKNPILRKDLYEKMIKVDENEPTDEENENKAITKLRYMQFREKESSTSSLGFRVEAVKMVGCPPKTDLKKLRERDDVVHVIGNYINKNDIVRRQILNRLLDIRGKIEESEFFKHHEMIGSSLLILYDVDNKASIWMIDFAKTTNVGDMTLDHRTPWSLGNHEDGYLFGIDNLIKVIEDVGTLT